MQINQIGEGLQGAVFEQVGHALAIKKEKLGNEHLPSNLKHEHKVHQAVYNSFDVFGPVVGSDICVPRPESFVSKPENQKFWDDYLSSFPDGYRQPGDVVWMERIHPVPEEVRKALVTRFYPFSDGDASETIDGVLETPSNKHALLRTYFGKRTPSLTTANFSLRNFPLCLEPMESLGMEMEKLVESLGQAYAIMHWGAGVDGDDVEFVLGTWPVTTAMEYKATNLQCRAMRYFLLDFGQCQLVDLSQDDYVVYQAFKGAMVTGDNQLFIPHYTRSPALFESFKQAYMEAGHKILMEKGLEGRFNMGEFMKEYLEYAEDFL